MGTLGSDVVSSRVRKVSPCVRLTVHQHDIPLLDALLAQHAGKRLDLVQQLLVGDGLLGARHGAVVEDGRAVAEAGVHVAVDAVVAGGQLAAREPLPVVVRPAALQLLARAREHGRGLLVPVELLGLVAPEGLRVGEGVVLHLVLRVSGHVCLCLLDGFGGWTTLKTLELISRISYNKCIHGGSVVELLHSPFIHTDFLGYRSSLRLLLGRDSYLASDAAVGDGRASPHSAAPTVPTAESPGKSHR